MQAPASSILGRAASGCRRAAGCTARYPGAGTGQHHGRCWLLLCWLPRWCVTWHPSHKGMAAWTWMHNSPGHRAAVPTAVLPAPPAQAWPHSIAPAAPALLWDGDGAGDGDAPCGMPSTAVGAGRTLCTSSLFSYPATEQPGQGASCLQLLIKTYARRSAIKLSLQCYAWAAPCVSGGVQLLPNKVEDWLAPYSSHVFQLE